MSHLIYVVTNPETGKSENFGAAAAETLMVNTSTSVDVTAELADKAYPLYELYGTQRLWAKLMERARLGTEHQKVLFCGVLPPYAKTGRSIFDTSSSSYHQAQEVLDIAAPDFVEQLAASFIVDTDLMYSLHRLLPQMAERGLYAPTAWLLNRTPLTHLVPMTEGAQRLLDVVQVLNPSGRPDRARARVCFSLAPQWTSSPAELASTADGILIR